jgi:hypothetical protein
LFGIIDTGIICGPDPSLPPLQGIVIPEPETTKPSFINDKLVDKQFLAVITQAVAAQEPTQEPTPEATART